MDYHPIHGERYISIVCRTDVDFTLLAGRPLSDWKKKRLQKCRLWVLPKNRNLYWNRVSFCSHINNYHPCLTNITGVHEFDKTPAGKEMQWSLSSVYTSIAARHLLYLNGKRSKILTKNHFTILLHFSFQGAWLMLKKTFGSRKSTFVKAAAKYQPCLLCFIYVFNTYTTVKTVTYSLFGEKLRKVVLSPKIDYY